MLNLSILIGRLTKDPELRYTPTGLATCAFTLAVDKPQKKDAPGPSADFLPIVTWRDLAETCASYLGKGKLVCVVGRTQTRSYEREGRKIYITEIIADTVRFLDGPKAKGEAAPELSSSELADLDLPF